MPSLLQNAYGDSWGSGMINGRTLGSQLGTTLNTESVQEVPVQQVTRIQESPLLPVLAPLPIRKAGCNCEDCHCDDGKYVFSVNLTIDQQDCHLLCLFLGVFTLAVLFGKNKKLSTSPL